MGNGVIDYPSVPKLRVHTVSLKIFGGTVDRSNWGKVQSSILPINENPDDTRHHYLEKIITTCTNLGPINIFNTIYFYSQSFQSLFLREHKPTN